MIKLIDMQIQASEAYDKQSTTDISNIKNQINKTIEEMISKLNHQKRQLFASLDLILEQKEKAIMTVNDGQEFKKTAVTSLMSYTDKMLRHGRDFVRLQQVGDIQSRLATVTQTRTVDDSARVRVADAVSGNLVRKIQLMRKEGVEGLVLMNQTVLVVHFGQNSVEAYLEMSPHQPQTLPIKGMADPAGMVRFPPGQSQLIISDCDNKQLLWSKLDRRKGVCKVTSQQSVKVSYRPLGLGVRENQLLVCGDDNLIHVLSTAGKETHRVNMPQGVRLSKAVAHLTSHGFVIRDFVNKQVVMVTEKGEILQTYRGQDGFNPGDIVCHGQAI